MTKRLQLALCGEVKELKQLPQATVNRTDVEGFCIFDEFCDAQVGMAHPESLGHIRYAATEFGVVQTIKAVPFEVTDLNGLLFCDLRQ